MKEIKYQQKYVRELVDMTIDLLYRKGGLVHVFHTLAKSRRQGWNYDIERRLPDGNQFVVG